MSSSLIVNLNYNGEPHLSCFYKYGARTRFVLESLDSFVTRFYADGVSTDECIGAFTYYGSAGFWATNAFATPEVENGLDNGVYDESFGSGDEKCPIHHIGDKEVAEFDGVMFLPTEVERLDFADMIFDIDATGDYDACEFDFEFDPSFAFGLCCEEHIPDDATIIDVPNGHVLLGGYNTIEHIKELLCIVTPEMEAGTILRYKATDGELVHLVVY